MSPSPIEKEKKKSALWGWLGLIPPQWRALAVIVGLALFFVSGSAVLFREERAQLPDLGRLSALTAAERAGGRSALPVTAATSAAPVPVTESPLPLPGILKKPPTQDELDEAGTKRRSGADGGKAVSAGKDKDKGKGGKEGAAQDGAQTEEDGGAPGFGGSRMVQGSLLDGQGFNGSRIISRLSGAFAWGSRTRLLQGMAGNASSKGRGVKAAKASTSGTYTGTVGGKTCSANVKDHPELKPMWGQLTEKRDAMAAKGCGETPCRACQGSSNACTCAKMRCESDALFNQINAVLCSKPTAHAAPVSALQDTPPPICMSDGTCSAAAPACGETTSGVDNCGKACTKTGAACCVPNGSCDASPACGTTATGKDNCGGSCTRTGSACAPPPVCVPGSCSATPACGKTATGTNGCGPCTKTGPACTYTCGSCTASIGPCSVALTNTGPCTTPTSVISKSFSSYFCISLMFSGTVSCTATNTPTN